MRLLLVVRPYFRLAVVACLAKVEWSVDILRSIDSKFMVVIKGKRSVDTIYIVSLPV